MSLATQLTALATRVGVEIKAVRTAQTTVNAAKQDIVRWSGTAWPARPVGAAFGVVFLSTNDVNATAPTDVNLAAGDVWKRHPNAV